MQVKYSLFLPRDAVTVPVAQEIADSAAERGRGIALMRALVDTVSFESQPQAGTIVHLVKTLELEDYSPLRNLPPWRAGV